MIKPSIKFGDILTFTDEWYKASGAEKPKKPLLLLATGKIKEQMPGDYVVYVVRENKSYIQIYHHSFLKKLKK